MGTGLKIWESYLLKKRRAKLDAKVDGYRKSILSINSAKRASKAISNKEKRNTLARCDM